MGTAARGTGDVALQPGSVDTLSAGIGWTVADGYRLSVFGEWFVGTPHVTTDPRRLDVLAFGAGGGTGLSGFKSGRTGYAHARKRAAPGRSRDRPRVPGPVVTRH